MRLFVALDLPEELRRELSRLASGVPGAKWVDEQNLHLTLRFIGEVDGNEVADIDAALSALTVETFSLNISGVGQFGEGRKVRALWAGVEPNEMLMRLQSKIERAVQSAGLPPEKRKFKPHITLARLNGPPSPKLRDFLSQHSLLRLPSFQVTEFVLYSSFLSQSGAIHSEEAVYHLDRSALVSR